MRLNWYQNIIFPLLGHLDPERAHHLALRILPFLPHETFESPPLLRQRIWNISFPNPIGLAAGFDKDGQALSALHHLGFGFLEVGTVTPKPQRGNPLPRLFRSARDNAIINRMGFNNEGAAALSAKLAKVRNFVLGVNIGKNKESLDEIADYVQAAKTLTPYADYITINISSPNTPGLRALQTKEKLLPLLDALRPITASLPLLVKIAPDLTLEERQAIAEIALNKYCDGLIISNTTIQRPAELDPEITKQSGGLSGKPLFSLSTSLLFNFYELTQGKVILIGAGGVEDANTAYRKIRAGASLVQLYSALIFKGPGLIKSIVQELPALIQADGFTHLHQAIGADHRKKHEPR